MSLQDPLLSAVSQDQYDSELKETPKTPLQKGLVLTFVLFIFASFIYFLYYTVSNTWNYIGPPTAVVSCGEVQGLWVGGDRPGNPPFAKFLGIPYAAPPTKGNRWQPAKPDTLCWNDTYDASWPGKICFQFGYQPYQYPMTNQSEDCLNLNVWTKNLDNANSTDSSKLLPVLFWIYGGSNVFGSQDTYPHVENWALNGDVCLIAPNYRLNIFGYLATTELSANDSRGVSGNYGITDLQEALRWVKKNARAFGCDPDQVTVFGQSSGGTNILALMSSSDSAGLFTRAISYSGSNNITMNLAAAEAQNENITKTICPNATTQADILECMYNAQPAQLLNATPIAWAGTSFWPTDPAGIFSIPGLVIVDGVTVERSWRSAAASPLVPGVDLILQSNRDELEFFYQSANQSVLKMTPAEYKQFLIDNFYPWNESSSVGTAINDQYQNVTNESNGGVQRSYYDLQSDFGIFCPQVEVGLLYANANPSSNVYVSVSWQPPSRPVSTYSGTPPLPDPFHLWDWIAATGSWDFFLVMSDGGVGKYSPSGVDSAYGYLMRSQVYEFIANGTITGVNTVNKAGADYYVLQYGDTNRTGQATNQANFRADYCDVLKQNGLNPDSRFWWVN